MLPNKTKCYNFFFGISTFLAVFLPKNSRNWQKNEENWQNPNRLMKFSEIWFVDASQQQKCYKKTFLDFGLFWTFFNQKTAKIGQKWRKLAKSKPFDETFWNLVCRCFPTKIKTLHKNLFLDFGLFWPFFNQKTAEIDQKWRKLAKPKTLGEIFWNLVFAGLKSG